MSSYLHLLAANEFMQVLMTTHIQERATGRMHLVDPRAERLFASALTDALAAQTEIRKAAARVFSVPISARDDQPAMVAHVIPVRRAARYIFSSAASIVIVTLAGAFGR